MLNRAETPADVRLLSPEALDDAVMIEVYGAFRCDRDGDRVQGNRPHEWGIPDWSAPGVLTITSRLPRASREPTVYERLIEWAAKKPGRAERVQEILLGWDPTWHTFPPYREQLRAVLLVTREEAPLDPPAVSLDWRFHPPLSVEQQEGRRLVRVHGVDLWDPHFCPRCGLVIEDTRLDPPGPRRVAYRHAIGCEGLTPEQGPA